MCSRRNITNFIVSSKALLIFDIHRFKMYNDDIVRYYNLKSVNYSTIALAPF